MTTKVPMLMLAVAVLAGCVEPPTEPTPIVPPPSPSTTLPDFVGSWRAVEDDAEFVSAVISADGERHAEVDIVASADCTANCDLSFRAEFLDNNLNGEYAYDFKIVTFTLIYDAPDLRVVGVHNYTDDSGREPHTSVDRMSRE